MQVSTISEKLCCLPKLMGEMTELLKMKCINLNKCASILSTYNLKKLS